MTDAELFQLIVEHELEISSPRIFKECPTNKGLILPPWRVYVRGVGAVNGVSLREALTTAKPLLVARTLLK